MVRCKRAVGYHVHLVTPLIDRVALSDADPQVLLERAMSFDTPSKSHAERAYRVLRVKQATGKVGNRGEV